LYWQMLLSKDLVSSKRKIDDPHLHIFLNLLCQI
jgi:hypothetical protein